MAFHLPAAGAVLPATFPLAGNGKLADGCASEKEGGVSHQVQAGDELYEVRARGKPLREVTHILELEVNGDLLPGGDSDDDLVLKISAAKRGRANL